MAIQPSQHVLNIAAVLLLAVSGGVAMTTASCVVGCPPAFTDAAIDGTWQGEGAHEDIRLVIGHELVERPGCSDGGHIRMYGTNDGDVMPWKLVAGTGPVEEQFSRVSGFVWDVGPDGPSLEGSAAELRITRVGEDRIAVSMEYAIGPTAHTDTFTAERVVSPGS